MERYIIDQYKNANVENFQVREELISTLKKRFITYGYKQVRTPTFESYDMYSNITGTVSKGEMIKVIDPSGEVLVLRPDVTIPLTKMTSASLTASIPNERLFYVLDVYRQSDERKITESTQAGIECFGENLPAIDAEVITLAIHTLKDLRYKNYKIEIGHAGFFKEIIEQIQLTKQQLEQLQSLIQSKNVIEMEPFLSTLTADTEIKEAIRQIPMMYGDAENVINQAQSLTLNGNMKKILHRLYDIYQVLKDFNVEDCILFNLGLINHMNYYSGVIFQGFVENAGKPVLMGGRYDHLGEQFADSLPAIGFAFDVDILLETQHLLGLKHANNSSVDILIYYDQQEQKKALKTAYQLRDEGYQVLTNVKRLAAKRRIYFNDGEQPYLYENSKGYFKDTEELLCLLKKDEGD